jgi:CubicO group peptidase (beta-lactamase class C family)
MIWLKRTLGYLLIICSTAVAVALLTGHGYLYKGIKEVWLRGWSSGNIDDLKFAYDSRTLKATDPVPWPEDLGKAQLSDSIEKWMDEERSASYLVIHRDTVIFEKYWRGHEVATLTNSFSMAKTIVAMAVGKAVDDGLIDVHAPLSKYIPRFSDGLGSTITVEHVLQMRTLIPFGESYSDPFGFPARAYYGGDIESLMEPYRPIAESGTEFEYQSGNTILLAELHSVVQDLNLTEYVSENIWRPMHAEYDAEWGLDAIDGLERSFAQFYSTTRDFARFGKLILDGGLVDSTIILSNQFVSDMITPIADDELGVHIPYYGYQTWLGQTESGLDFSYLRGHRGQYVISIPEIDLIVVRTGYQRDENLLRNLSLDTYIYIETALDIAKQREQL